MNIGASLEALVPRVINTDNPKETLENLLGGVVSSLQKVQLASVEIPLDAMILYPTLFTEESLGIMADVLQQHGVAVSVHLPFMWCDPSSLDEDVRSASVKNIIRSAKTVQDFHPITYALHLTGERGESIGASHTTNREKLFYFTRMAEQAKKSLREISQELDPPKLCVENLTGFPFELLREEVKAQKARICFDVGHYVLQGGDPILFLETNLRHIGLVHLHDVAPIRPDGTTRLHDHQPLGSGIVNGPRILSTLKRKRFTGPVIIEVPTLDALTRSIINLTEA